MTLVYIYKFSYSLFGGNKLKVGVEVGNSFKISGLYKSCGHCKMFCCTSLNVNSTSADMQTFADNKRLYG